MRTIDADALKRELGMARTCAGCVYDPADCRWDRQLSREYVCSTIDEIPTIGMGWINVKTKLPEPDQTVLAIKKLKNGRLEYALARCIPDWESKDYQTGEVTRRPYWVCGGNNNVIWWTPLPEVPDDPV